MPAPEQSRSQPSRPRNRPGEGGRLREEIIDAASRLLAGGVRPAALSLRAVAREASITAPAIYAHFSGLDDLLAAVVERRFARFSRHLSAAVEELPTDATPADELLARTVAYCRFGLEHPSDYELLFGRGEAYGGVPYDNSAGQIAFDDLTRAVATVRPDLDATFLSACLWPALHGVVTARIELAAFPWPPLEAQVSTLVRGLVPSASAVEPD
jgi:AcrR family transcriptional regulator